jgi:nitrite reductase/ring-hydroxylating ferredoxin subunit/uncharacterized membrane protein
VPEKNTRQSTATPDNAAAPSSPALLSSPFERIFGTLESIHGVDGVGDAIAGALTPLTNRAALMDLLHGRWLGHALHPVLSDLPIGLWGSAVILDVIGDERGATALTAGGCAAAVATVATGAADWSVTVGRDRRLGLIHGLVNAAALLFELGALTARMLGRRRIGQLLSIAGVGTVAGTAFLGGELVFGRGLMVNHSAWATGPLKWTQVLADAELAEGAMLAVDVEGRKVLLARINGAVSAMENTCSHAGGPLAEGTREDGCVICPWHGSRFRLTDGAVMGGPATFPQLQLQVRQRKGQIEVRGRAEGA